MKILLLSAFILGLLSCNKKSAEEEAPPGRPKYLYVSSGACYSGTGNTTYTATTSSNVVYRLNPSTGIRDLILFDYNKANPGDSPVGLVNMDDSYLYVLVENAVTTGNRRIEKLSKDGLGTRMPFVSNSPSYTPINGTMKKIVSSGDGGLFIIRNSGTPASAIEKVGADGIRIGAPFITNAMTGACGATNTFQDVLSVSSGKVIATSSAASNTRFSLLPASGYSGTCLAAQTSPDPVAYPTAIAYVPSANQLIVGYAGNSTAANINSIYVYDFNDAANTISNPTRIYDVSVNPPASFGNLYGISAMTYDPDENALYVAASTGTTTTITNHNYAIEKFTYNPGTKTLSRSTSGTPFFTSGFETKCISSMIIVK